MGRCGVAGSPGMSETGQRVSVNMTAKARPGVIVYERGDRRDRREHDKRRQSDRQRANRWPAAKCSHDHR